MKGKKAIFLPAVILLGMICLILDSACATEQAGQAIDLCLKTVIPGLFPMFVLSGLLVSSCSLWEGRILRWLEEILSLPHGGGAFFLLGLIGGFPVGAQCISQSVHQHGLTKQNGEQMLGFCNNCGPAFLFGITATLFRSPWAPLLLFLIQAECAALCAIIWPCAGGEALQVLTQKVNVTDAVYRAIRSMAAVCAWVVLGSVFTGFLERWLFPFLPEIYAVMLSGVLELTGGVLALKQIRSESLRLVLCSLMINWGGLCVHFQIHALAASAGLSIRSCIRQKVMQSLLGVLLSAGLIATGPAVLLAAPCLIFLRKKVWKNKAGPCIMATVREGSNHAVP